MTLRIAIVHFHLRTGGVTRVLHHALEALASQDVEIAVLSGESPTEPLPTPASFRVLRGLGYEETREPISGADLAAQMRTAARELLGGEPDLWHFHNHSLGKNLAAPQAIHSLARAGRPVLLHIHDFAEDGRPALYNRMLQTIGAGDSGRLSELLYPVAPHVHYAALNVRDRRLLGAAGVPASQLHALPNAVWLPQPGTESAGELPFPAGKRLWLYPTRAIRRKNLGELLLWSALGEENDLFATTQAPQNPAERPVYARWKAIAGELELPLAFELGMRYRGDFLHLLQSAHALVSTSITEGFGLAFLEPFLVGRPLAGRDLPEITGDFAGLGVDLGPLYQHLPIPLNWLDTAQLRRRIGAGLERTLHAYGRTPSAADADRAWESFSGGGKVDFGRLDEPLQEQVIRHLGSDPGSRGELELQRLPADPDPQRIDHNRGVIESQFSLERYGERLSSLYHELAASEPAPLSAASGADLLDAFLAPERLFLLKA